MENDLVRYSRAGDAFHYRWAARRCLRLIYPGSRLRSIVIEGSEQKALAGEYVIDVAEYSDSSDGDRSSVEYIQLKHTTTRIEQPFQLSDLRVTFEGFAKRWAAHFAEQDEIWIPQDIHFSIVTNRSVASRVKKNIYAIANNLTSDSRFQNTLETYTGLKGNDLSAFCTVLRFADGEGNYDQQRGELQAEVAQLVAGTVDSPRIDSIVALVQKRALPDSDGRIIREDILQLFGITSERDLYPAPAQFEPLEDLIPRLQYQRLLDDVIGASGPVIIHAVAGVGKSVFARQILQSLPIGWFGVVYDCFGAGRYLNRSEPRHRQRDAAVQMANELASHGLCDPLIVQSYALDDEILRAFLARIRSAAEALRKVNEKALLLIIIDAADNAEMAAERANDNCFVHDLLREPVPDGCRVVALCRTERIHLLQPASSVLEFELDPFSQEETLHYLRQYFPDASDTDGLEFHRLTNNGNPRVQANALSRKYNKITEVLASLGPAGTSVEKQIEAQLDTAISRLKEKLPLEYQEYVDSICSGLATLPPLIPITVLATAAKVEESAVISLVTDLGRPLWLSDTSVQFRDEPTETWFRERFSATPDQIASYITRLEPLAAKYTYVAETIPPLLLRAQRYDELISLALSDNLLPEHDPINERNVRIFRLQFAFRAALKQERYTDSIKLALRAGEEVAGDQRQLELLKKNVDLVAALQNEQTIQELAFHRLLRSGWDGSENAYTAALLASVDDFRGEARTYLRAAHNWLQLYFETRKSTDPNHFQERLEDDDLVVMVLAHFHLSGANELTNFVLGWRPPQVTYRIARKLIRRLVDAGDFATIDEIFELNIPDRLAEYQYLVIALTHELLDISKYPPRKVLRRCLDLLTAKSSRIPRPKDSYFDTSGSALISFLEACAVNNLSTAKILRALSYYVPMRASRSVADRFPTGERDIYLRATALRCLLADRWETNIDELLPKAFVGSKNKRNQHSQEIEEFKEIVSGLLPWYILRSYVLAGKIDDLSRTASEVDHKSKKARTHTWRDANSIDYEYSRLYSEILVLCRNADTEQIRTFFSTYLKENKQFQIIDRLYTVRCACRVNHLSGIKKELELSARDTVDAAKDQDSLTKAEWYVELARAVYPGSVRDASTYFDQAIVAVSKFGDEITERWDAVVALANQAAESGRIDESLTYRFIRCAELVGDNVDREKHFNRNGAVETFVRLSPAAALAAVSRWRDRDIGWFDRQLPALAGELVRSSSLPASVTQSLSAFFEDYGLEDFAEICLEKEIDTARHQYILDTLVRDLSLTEATADRWEKVRRVSQQLKLRNSTLDRILAFYGKTISEKTKTDVREVQSPVEKPEEEVWNLVFDGVDLHTSSGITLAIRRFDSALSRTHNKYQFWQETLRRLSGNDAYEFLTAITAAEAVDRYDIEAAISLIPMDWKTSISVERYWPTFLKEVSRRFASQLTTYFILDHFCQRMGIDSTLMPTVRQGIMEGLSESTNFVEASTFFGFVDTVSILVSPKEAIPLLDFALARFELHMDKGFGDGEWSSWLLPPTDQGAAFAGFVWSALGSPRGETRWRAAHCVRRLGEIGCSSEIEALIQWMERDEVRCFGSKLFPFYNLHARQYLLIALARISVDHSQILRPYHEIFSRCALGSFNHILIQKLAAEIALNIEKAYPGTYKGSEVEALRSVGVSKLPVKEFQLYSSPRLQSYWHERGEVDTTLKHLHGYDFDRYWFEPLANVFGISAEQVEQLATEVVVRDWKIAYDGGFDGDPRAVLWHSSSSERETWHDHGSYPQTDRYSFYLSYHSMLVVAAKLVQKMPIVKSPGQFEDNEDPWIEWLQRHSLTRNDGRWLADRRDPAPLEQRAWTRHQTSDKWRMEIAVSDFLDGLLFERNGETWLNVSGFWQEGDRERGEHFHLSSALVSPAASQALLNALTDASDPYDYKLPDYQEDQVEIEQKPFELKGWTWRPNTYNRLDEADPHSGGIDYPPYQIGQSILERMGLSADNEQREWFLPNSDSASILCELWRTNKLARDEDPLRSGERISTSLRFLKQLCSTQECEIIFAVEVDRRFKHSSYSRDKDKDGYTPPHKKIYLLSAEGELRDTETSYQLR